MIKLMGQTKLMTIFNEILAIINKKTLLEQEVDRLSRNYHNSEGMSNILKIIIFKLIKYYVLKNIYFIGLGGV